MKTNATMEARVSPDGALEWIVTSSSRPEIEHRVDLAAFSGVGRCSCEHFEFRIAPDLRVGSRIGAHRCSHILVARNAFCDAMIQTIGLYKREKTTCDICGETTESEGAICLECRIQIDEDETDT